MNFLPALSRTPWLTALSGFSFALVLALTFALFGWFSLFFASLALVLFLGAIGIAITSLFRSKDYSRLFLLAFLASLAFIIAFRAEPSIFTGRDQGSIGLAALELAKNHELAFRNVTSDALFEIYGPGRALNFPGFSYTESGALITQFPLGYTSYLALFVSWFGVNGLLVGNAFLFILSGWSFFELLTLFVSRRTALYGTGLFATSFIVIWLTELALTENLALLLYLTLAGALTRLERDNDTRFLPLVIITAFLFALTRIEGFAIAGLVIMFLIFRPKLRAHLFALPKYWTIPTLVFFAFLLLRDLFMNLPFYTMIGKAALKYWQELNGTAAAGSDSDPALGPILFSYGLFPIFILGIASLLFGVMKRRFTLLVPVLIAAPTLLYLFNGHISDDHPWMLRRYAFTLFPLFLLATACLIEELATRSTNVWKSRIVPAIFAILFAIQCYPALQAIQTKEHSGLLGQAEYLSKLFTPHDLILIDRGASGDPFALLAGPLSSLYERNAVYFFNSEDYGRLDRSKFDHIYLLTAEDSLGRYYDVFSNRLLPVQTISFTFPVLSAKTPYAMPEENQIMSDTLLFRITE